jgi:hypothetical protein
MLTLDLDREQTDMVITALNNDNTDAVSLASD